MLAVEISRHGGPGVVVPVDRADPVPARGEVLVRNRWVGVNYIDLQHREGRPYPVTLPLVPGTEAAGSVVAVGPGVDAGLVGKPVVHFGHLAGVYAELTAVPLDYVVPLPPVTALDVAKGLMDHGFHPPTIYFPLIVPEALMIEPTETEAKETLDEFAEAMLAIARDAEERPEVLKEALSRLSVLGR